MKSQRQRSRARAVQDKKDFDACMERNDWTCQKCKRQAEQMHHGRRKHVDIRHDPRYHYALCYECHRWAHDHVAAWIEWMNDNPNT